MATDDLFPEGLPATASFAGGMSCPCNTCAHVYPDGATCEAFPDEIPREMLAGRYLHRQNEPYPGDRGIRYEYAPILGTRPPWA